MTLTQLDLMLLTDKLQLTDSNKLTDSINTLLQLTQLPLTNSLNSSN